MTVSTVPLRSRTLTPEQRRERFNRVNISVVEYGDDMCSKDLRTPDELDEFLTQLSQEGATQKSRLLVVQDLFRGGVWGEYESRKQKRLVLYIGCWIYVQRSCISFLDYEEVNEWLYDCVYITTNGNIGMSIVNAITCPMIAASCDLGIKRIEEGRYQRRHPKESEVSFCNITWWLRMFNLILLILVKLRIWENSSHLRAW